MGESRVKGRLNSELPLLVLSQLIKERGVAKVFRRDVWAKEVESNGGLTYGQLREAIHSLIREGFDVQMTIGNLKKPKLKFPIYEAPVFLMEEDILKEDIWKADILKEVDRSMFIHIGPENSLQVAYEWNKDRGRFEYFGGQASVRVKLKESLQSSQIEELKYISQRIMEEKEEREKEVGLFFPQKMR